MDAGAGRDFRPDHFPFAVEHMTATVESVTARTVAVNNESFGRLISSRLASFNSYGRVGAVTVTPCSPKLAMCGPCPKASGAIAAQQAIPMITFFIFMIPL
jgi:hypothetical protein